MLNQQKYSSEVTLHFERSAPPADGQPTVVLIHGLGASLETWHDLYPILSSATPTVRVDLKGFGRSPKPRDQQYRPADQANLVLALLDSLPDTRLVLVGHSYGAGIALLVYFYLLKHRRTKEIEALVLMDAAVFPQKYPFFVEWLRNPIVLNTVNCVTSPNQRMRYVLSRIVRNAEVIDGARVERYARFLTTKDARRSLAMVARQLDPDTGREIASELPSIRVPTLIIWGRYDTVISIDKGERLRDAIPNAQLRIIEDAGHIPHEERPRATAAVLQSFIAGLSE